MLKFALKNTIFCASNACNYTYMYIAHIHVYIYSSQFCHLIWEYNMYVLVLLVFILAGGTSSPHESATPTQSTVSTIGGGGGEDTPTDWTAMKQTPSFDSGLASHITSILPSEGKQLLCLV